MWPPSSRTGSRRTFAVRINASAFLTSSVTWTDTTLRAITSRTEMLIAACQRHKKIPGLLVQDVATAKEWISKGVLLVPYANEVSLLVNAGAKAVSEIRSFASSARKND